MGHHFGALPLFGYGKIVPSGRTRFVMIQLTEEYLHGNNARYSC